MSECCGAAGVTRRVVIPSQLVLNHEKDETWMLGAGLTLQPGAPLGLPTGGTELIESLPGAADGSQIPVGFTLCAVDTTAGAVEGVVLTEGELNYNELNLDAAWTKDLLKERLAQNRGLYVTEPVWAGATP